MPTYPYDCIKCDKRVTIIKRMKNAGREEVCPDCGEVMRRLWTVPGAVVAKSGYYDHGLGAEIHTTDDKREALKRIRDGYDMDIKVAHPDGSIEKKKVHREGADLVEVGTDKGGMDKIKPKRKKYELPAGELDNVRLVD